jgi:hypothetical protein
MPACPGLTGAPRVSDCPAKLVLHSGDLSQPIPDGGASQHAIPVTGIPTGCRVTDVDLFIAAKHDQNSDLVAELLYENPAVGSDISTLFDGICDITANIVTTLDDDATQPIGSVCPPIGGRYRTNPPGGLDAFDGFLPEGDWTLRLTDTANNGADGELLNWTLEIRTDRD